MATWTSDGSLTNAWNGTTGGVQTIHDRSQTVDGDTITVPNGNFSWTVMLLLTKAVIIQGNTTTNSAAGTAVENTIITDNLSNRGNPMIKLQNGGQRITGLAFEPGVPTTNNQGIVSIEGGIPVRVDHCYFGEVHAQNAVVWVAYRNYGVMDHCVRVATEQHGICICYWTRQMGADLGDFDFEQPAGWGGPNFFFVEDCWFGDATDISWGGKLCLRHNHIWANANPTSGMLVSHGTGRSQSARGGRAYEIYNNDFHYKQNFLSLDGPDSGSWLFHDNTFENQHFNLANGLTLGIWRQFWNYGTPFFGANGFNAWDQFATEADGTYVPGNPTRVFESGTFTGSFIDSSKNWTTNQWQGYEVSRVSDLATAAIQSNTATTLTTSQFANANWQAGDQYRITKPLKILDGPGYGAGSHINRASPAYPSPASEPMYSWNNINTDDGSHINFRTPENYLKYTLVQNRDYFNDTVYNYTTYTYPHPLVGGTTRIISLSGPGLAFGNVTIGSSSPTATLTVANQGNSLLTVSAVSYPTGFSGQTTGFTVPAGSSFDIVVTFTPLVAQLYSGNITVTSDATSGNNTIAVSGTGIDPTPPVHGHKKQARDAFQF